MPELWPDRSRGELCRLVVPYDAAVCGQSTQNAGDSGPTASGAPDSSPVAAAAIPSPNQVIHR